MQNPSAKHAALGKSLAPTLKTALTLALVLACSASTPALAHIIPVDFGGTFDPATFTTPIAKNNGVTGNFGWADGADVDWADTHKTAT